MPYETLPKTRAEAKRLGFMTYFTGLPCKYGHISPRRTGNSNCVACGREYDKRNAIIISVKKRLYYLTNKEKIALAKSRCPSRTPSYIRDWNIAYYQNNKEYCNAASKIYHASPRGKAARKTAFHRRRAREAEASGTHTAEELEKIIARGTRCYICGKKFTKSNPPEIDHVIALAHELGSNDAGNLAIAHRSCNRAKQTSRFNPVTGQGILI